MWPQVQRIIDANANRAREALRVMEDAARFALDDAALSEQIKQLRHELSQLVRQLGPVELSRNTPGDVGREIKTDAEAARSSVVDVVTAAGKRLGEALRTIEEYGKTLRPDVAASVEKLRYRGYHVEQRLLAGLPTGRARQWRLCVLISEALCRGGDWWGLAQQVVDGGADCIQLREKQLPQRALLERARRLVAYCRPRGVSVIINDCPSVALLSDADGLHLGQEDIACSEIRRLAGRQLIIGVSTCCIEQARDAVREGADYCGLGPMFPTTTKQKDVIAGPSYAGEFVRKLPHVPHLAIGGITADNVGQVIEAGGRGAAVSSAVCSADNPRMAVRQLLEAMDASEPTAGV